jgi:hypothetical protein
MQPADLYDCQRYIEAALQDAGFNGCIAQTKLDGEGKTFAEITIDGRTASGLPDLVLGAIEEAKNYNTLLAKAFESRNMFAGPI